jgi:metallo-beta-lactamase class B
MMNPLRTFAILSAFGVSAAAAAATGSNAINTNSVNNHMAAAAKAAGYEHTVLYNMTCARLGDPSGGRQEPPHNDRDQSVWATPPVKVFDNLYFLGEKNAQESHSSAWAVTTSAGIILIDALADNSVEPQVVEGLKKLGLDPKAIKYVLVTHAHFDHFGGAKYLQDTFNARVMMAQPDWDYLNSPGNAGLIRPRKDIVVTDGQKFTLGDTTLNLYVTPGHTPGTVSILLPVFDKGQPHLAAMWGGTGWTFPANAPDQKKLAIFKTYHASAERFLGIVAKADADVVFSNHPSLDRTDEKNAALAVRGAGDINPWIIGKEKTRNYMEVASACSAAGLASFR